MLVNRDRLALRRTGLQLAEHRVDRLLRDAQRLRQTVDLVGPLHGPRAGDYAHGRRDAYPGEPRGDRAGGRPRQRRVVEPHARPAQAEGGEHLRQRVGRGVGRPGGQPGGAARGLVGALGEVDVEAAVADDVIGGGIARGERRSVDGRDDEGGAGLAVHGEDLGVEHRARQAPKAREVGDVRTRGRDERLDTERLERRLEPLRLVRVHGAKSPGARRRCERRSRRRDRRWRRRRRPPAPRSSDRRRAWPRGWPACPSCSAARR